MWANQPSRVLHRAVGVLLVLVEGEDQEVAGLRSGGPARRDPALAERLLGPRVDLLVGVRALDSRPRQPELGRDLAHHLAEERDAGREVGRGVAALRRLLALLVDGVLRHDRRADAPLDLVDERAAGVLRGRLGGDAVGQALREPGGARIVLGALICSARTDVEGLRSEVADPRRRRLQPRGVLARWTRQAPAPEQCLEQLLDRDVVEQHEHGAAVELGREGVPGQRRLAGGVDGGLALGDRPIILGGGLGLRLGLLVDRVVRRRLLAGRGLALDGGLQESRRRLVAGEPLELEHVRGAEVAVGQAVGGSRRRAAARDVDRCADRAGSVTRSLPVASPSRCEQDRAARARAPLVLG